VFPAIQRYLVREIAYTFLAVLTVLAAISITNTLARFLGRVAEGRIPGEAVLALLALQSVPLFAVLVPLGLLLGIMLAFGRLYRDNEMTAMMACGLGPSHFYRSVLFFGLPLVLGLTWFSLYGAPWALRLASELALQAEQAAATMLTEPGQFREMAGGRAVAYSEEVDNQSGELRGVFIHLSQDQHEVVLVAARGRQYLDPESGARYVQLEDGERLETQPGSLELRRLRFQRMRMLLEPGDPEAKELSLDEMPLAELMAAGPELRSLAELHWRLAPPAVALVLMLVAPPLSHSQPREGRYGRVVLAVLYFIVYVNLLGLGRAWLEAGALPAYLGLWWVHALMLLGAISFARGPYRLRLQRGPTALAEGG
jgi:lipopolysaccharide export system permease protein